MKLIRDSSLTMRYNPYAQAKYEAEFINMKNHPNTFNNLFSRDVRVVDFPANF